MNGSRRKRIYESLDAIARALPSSLRDEFAELARTLAFDTYYGSEDPIYVVRDWRVRNGYDRRPPPSTPQVSFTTVAGVAWWSVRVEEGACDCCRRTGQVHRGFNGGLDMKVLACDRCRRNGHAPCRVAFSA